MNTQLLKATVTALAYSYKNLLIHYIAKHFTYLHKN